MTDQDPPPSALSRILPLVERVGRMDRPPLPAPEAADAPLGDAEVVLFSLPRGTPFSLRFAGAYEPFVFTAKGRIVSGDEGEARELLLFVHRHLPALYGALDQARGLFATLTPRGVIVTGVLDFADEKLLDHSRLRRLLGETFAVPRFSWLGPLPGLYEVGRRARLMYASGTRVEMRREEDGFVVGRRVLRIDRG